MRDHQVTIRVMVSVAGWRAMKITALMMATSLLMIRDLEERANPKRIEAIEVCGADRVLWASHLTMVM